MKDTKDTQTVDIDAALTLFKGVTKSINGISSKDVSVFAGTKKESVAEPFVLLFYESLSELVMQDKMSITDMKVMLGICGLARFGNLVSLSQGGLAETLNLHRAAVSRSIKRLTESNVILKSKLGLFINPTLVVKGGLSNIDPELWDAALLAGSASPVKSVARKQSKNKNFDTEDMF